MAEPRRPYASYSIEDLEAVFSAQHRDVTVLTQLVQELSLRKLPRARRLLVVAAKKLDDLESEAEAGCAPSTFDNDASPQSDTNWEAVEYESVRPPANDDAINAAKPSGRPGMITLDRDRPPDDRKRPERLSRVRPVGTAGLPPPWVRPLNAGRPLAVPANADLPQVYAAALSALIAEIKATGAGQKRYELENGIRGGGKEPIYEFSFTDAADLFEDAKVMVEVSGRRVEGSIVSIGPGRLWLAIDEELGRVLQRVVLVVDATALLEALKQRIEDVSKGVLALNRIISDSVVGKGKPPANPPAIAEAPSNKPLDIAQGKARQRALTASITYIWGPPGCGKTFLLSEIVRSGFESGKRILICSNTNKAVDQVIYRICKNLGKQHPAMQDGRIVRLGRIADDRLATEYDAYVTVEGIVERRSVSIKARLGEVQGQLARIDKRTAEARIIIDRFMQFDAAQSSVDNHLAATNGLVRAAKDIAANFRSILAELQKLDSELEKRRNALFAIFKRSEEAIQKDILAAQARRSSIASKLENTKTLYDESKARFESAKIERDRLHERLRPFNRAHVEHVIAGADKDRAPLFAELRELESKINDLRAAVTKEAKVLGATCAKTYLTARDIGQVEMVIIDEASMVLLPMVWFAAGLAKDRVIVCGDFRQIPPIVQTSQQTVYDVLGHDVFAAAGLDNPLIGDPRRVMLDTQRRMDSAICRLISEPMYGGLLKSAIEGDQESIAKKPAVPFDGTLTVVDTSDLWPFESVNAFYSRFNLMHALLARNLAWHLHGQGYIQAEEDLAICTPYAAQSKLIGKLLETEGLGKFVRVGTVHSFQGDERNAIVLELPESHGGARMLGQFLRGIPPKDVGARLMNVAVSRAKNHLIVIANLTYLDRLLPSASLLRGILYDIQRSGRVIPGAELLALRPIESDLRGLFDRVPLDLDAKTMGIFNQSTFDAAIEADLSNAKESIIIFSGFVTPSRVAKLGDLLRMKTIGGVKIRCVTRPPKLNGSMDLKRSKEALDDLEGLNCVVDCRARIHEKIVLIDKRIVWHGSLNVLSHTHLTDESMTRVVNSGLAAAVAANVSKRRVSADKALQTVGDAENPRCGRCGARTVYNEGRYGPYFYCEDECGWSVNLKNAPRP
jgi:hypothetical protein